jgi:energy-coupling factor transporter ATP-binding protein EcfA2
LSAAENVGVPLRIAGMAPKEREERVRLMLDIVGLGEHARQRPAELSGGQQQRVAIARALAGRPQVLLADEPTGQLDSETGKQIMRLLRTVVQSEGVTALVATHDPNLIGIADSVLELEDGKIKSDLGRTVQLPAPDRQPVIVGLRGPARGSYGPRSWPQVTGVPSAEVRSANRDVSRLVTGPGVPSPMLRPSTDTTGARPPMVPVTNASSAV